MNIRVLVDIGGKHYHRGMELGQFGLTKLPDFIIEATVKMIVDAIIESYKEENE